MRLDRENLYSVILKNFHIQYFQFDLGLDFAVIVQPHDYA